MESRPLWFLGICDNILIRIQQWYDNWENGQIYATRDFLEKTGKITKIPTVRYAKVQFSLSELDQLVYIVSTLEPKSEWINFLSSHKASIKKTGQLVPGGSYLIGLAAHKVDLEVLLAILKKAKSGNYKVTLESKLNAKREANQDFWSE